MPKRERTAIYPGTFDPITYGHIDLIERGLKVFDRIIVAVATNEPKEPLFSVRERVEMVEQTIGRKRHVKVEASTA